MHEFAKFVRESMDGLRWSPADLARHSGLSRSHVSKIINDKRQVLAALPDVQTVSALAKAFHVSDGKVLDAAARAAGLEVRTPTTPVSPMSDTELLTELGRRLAGAGPVIPPLDLNTLPDSAVAGTADLMRKLRTDSKQSAASDLPGMAQVQAHLADYLEQLAKLARSASERKSRPDPAHS